MVETLEYALQQCDTTAAAGISGLGFDLLTRMDAATFRPLLLFGLTHHICRPFSDAWLLALCVPNPYLYMSSLLDASHLLSLLGCVAACLIIPA